MSSRRRGESFAFIGFRDYKKRFSRFVFTILCSFFVPFIDLFSNLHLYLSLDRTSLLYIPQSQRSLLTYIFQSIYNPLIFIFHFMRQKARLCALMACLMLVIGSAFAQVTTSGLNGKITDGREELIGASVVAIHVPTGSSYGTITDMDGRYQLAGMRPGGPYKLTISYVGYNTEEFTDLKLPLGETITMDVKLGEQRVQLGEATIVAKAGFNSQRTGSASNINQEKLSQMPTISRSLNDFTRLVPQASPSGNGMSFAGANNRYNSFQIDGAVNNDVFGLSASGTNGSQAGSQPISLDAIEEIQVVIAPFDVRQSGFTGGGVNAVTKSGTNDFKASVYAYGNNQALAGTTAGADIEHREKLSRQYDAQYGISLGGALLKNKLFFFVNAEQQRKANPLAYNVATDGVIGENDSQITKEEADLVVNKVKDLTGGYDGGGYGPRDGFMNSTKALARIDWNISDKHKMTLRYNFVTGKNLSLSRSNKTLRFNDNGFIYNNKTHSLVGELNSQLNSRMNNEFRVGYTRVRDQRSLEADNPFPFVKIKMSSGRMIQLGTEDNSGANALEQDIITLTDNFSWNVGKHNLTFGTHNELFLLENLYIRNLYGSYTYSSLDDFLSIGTANEAMPEQYYYGHAREEITGRPDWAPRFAAAQLGFYAQDQWDVTDRFRLTYGVRMDIPVFIDKPRANEAFNNSEIARQHGYVNQTMPKSTPLFSPRAGFRWNMTQDRSSVLRGGLGIFSGRIPFVWISNSFQNTGIEYAKYQYDAKNPFPSDFKFNADVNNQYRGEGVKTTEVNLVTRDFKFPQVMRANLAFEQLLPGGIRATFEGLYTKNLNDINYRNLLVEETGGSLNNFGDNRPMVNKKRDENFTNIMLLENTNKGYTYNVSAKFEKSFNFGLDLMASYTLGESKGVIDGSGSVAYSNWQYNEQYAGPNTPEVSYTDYDNRHRVLSAATYSKAYAKNFRTSVSLIYTGNTGANYSMIYNGDINGDGIRGNDLMYVPTNAEIDQMKFRPTNTLSADAQKANLKEFIGSHKDLKKMRGKIAQRNALHAPFEHHFDFRVAQDFIFGRNTIQVSLDILNVGNLLNRAWGLYYRPGFNHNPLSVMSVDDTNTPEFQFNTDPNKSWIGISDYDSRWRAQLGVKYIF